MSELKIAEENVGNAGLISFGNAFFSANVLQIKKIESYSIGDAIKVLKKKGSYTDAKVTPGVIVSFDEFKSHKAIVVMLLEEDYSSANIEFITIQENDEKYEFIPYDGMSAMFQKDTVVQKFDRMIEKKQMELTELQAKRSYFVQGFAAAFDKIKMPIG